MRQEDVNRFNEPYPDRQTDLDQRFNSALGVDVPHATKLTEEIFNDLDTRGFGISWWAQLLPDHERILISDYLYQCATGIEVNLAEAKLHFLEWLDTRDQQNERVVNMTHITDAGEVVSKLPPATKPMDDIPHNMEKLHIGGFFRAIGSAFDCLGAAIVAVLGLPVHMRYADINSARGILKKVKDDGTSVARVKVEFREFLEDVIITAGPEDWFDWTTQYRNMFVHRGRRMMMNHLTGRKPVLYDRRGFPIPRMETTFHLAKHPDKSDVEAGILGPTMLNEDASVTLDGVFKSSRELIETVCERLVMLWAERRKDPALIAQPLAQWNAVAKNSAFKGYKPETPYLSMDVFISNPAFMRRMLSASMDDQHRALWNGTKWEIE
jgi:hypothetical protein